MTFSDGIEHKRRPCEVVTACGTGSASANHRRDGRTVLLSFLPQLAAAFWNGNIALVRPRVAHASGSRPRTTTTYNTQPYCTGLHHCKKTRDEAVHGSTPNVQPGGSQRARSTCQGLETSAASESHRQDKRRPGKRRYRRDAGAAYQIGF